MAAKLKCPSCDFVTVIPGAPADGPAEWEYTCDGCGLEITLLQPERMGAEAGK